MVFRVSEDMGFREEREKRRAVAVGRIFLSLGKYGWPVLFGCPACPCCRSRSRDMVGHARVAAWSVHGASL